MSKKNKNDPKNTEKKPYAKPKLQTESLTVVAAICNGVAGGGRKAAVGPPASCATSKLKS